MNDFDDRINEHLRKKRRRDALIAEVANGLSPEEAEEIAALEGVGPLLPTPDPQFYDGYAQRRWTLLMAYSWAAFGQRPQVIRNYYPPYRQGLYRWVRSGAGHTPAPEQYFGIWDVIRTFGDNPYDDALALWRDAPGPGAIAMWHDLRARFSNGEIETFAQDFRRQEAGFVPIPPDDWRALVVFPVEQLPGNAMPDLLGFVQGKPIYTNVVVDRTQLLAAYPPGTSDAEEMLALPAQEHEPAEPTTEEADPGPLVEQSDPAPVLKTGAPGRPSSMHLVENELDRRIEDGETFGGVASAAADLHSWFREAYPLQQAPTAKTIANRLRSKIRSAIAVESQP